MLILSLILGLLLGLALGILVVRSKYVAENAVLRSQLQQSDSYHQQQLDTLHQQHTQLLQQQSQLLREQLTTASERILRERSEQLTTTNREQMSVILNPLQQNIKLMQEAMDKNNQQSTATMQVLNATIRQSMEQSREIGERADKLATALTGENKTQGNFGELRLKQLLENMGLVEGEQYEEQVTMRDADGQTILEEEEGRRMIPDVILHFPDQRDVIIDSKMSITAFQDYHTAETDALRTDALRRHVASMRAHVNELSRKNYSKYLQPGRGHLDFVVMYVFSESALQLALSHDTTLWREAYDRGVIISGSQNLYMMLRVLEMTWKQVRQVENQENIMKCANDIVDRVQLFAERFARVEEMLGKTQEAIDEVKKSTAPSGLSITTAASRLLKYGAQENPKRKKTIQ